MSTGDMILYIQYNEKLRTVSMAPNNSRKT